MHNNDIKKLIKILEESKIDELEVSTFWGKQKIRLRKSCVVNEHDIQIKNNTPEQIVEEENSRQTQKYKTQNDEIINLKPSEKVIEQESELPIEDAITIKAPLVGTFYISSKPDTPPFISEGDDIKEGQIICIIEAMKIFNEIESEYSGKVLKILVKDATPVEYDQELLIISPE